MVRMEYDDRRAEELSELLKRYDGKDVSVLKETVKRFQPGDFDLAFLAPLIVSREAFVSEGATWLLKACAENGQTPNPKVITAIVANLDQVTAWQAALHICQMAALCEFTAGQARRFADWASQYLTHQRPFMRAWSMHALQCVKRYDSSLTQSAEAALRQAELDPSASVRARARRIRAEQGRP